MKTISNRKIYGKLALKNRKCENHGSTYVKTNVKTIETIWKLYGNMVKHRETIRENMSRTFLEHGETW